MNSPQDVFISHASADKEQYISPLASALSEEHVTFWLDAFQIGWGDDISVKINQGLRDTRYVLLCLSRNFLTRSWPESEMSAALAVQNETRNKRVLPLILNSKDAVLKQYPLLAGLAYREYNSGPKSVAIEVANVVRPTDRPAGEIHITVESAHTGQLCNLSVKPTVSIEWITQKAQGGLGLSTALETGGFSPFMIRWVLIDVKAKEVWDGLSRSEKREVSAVVASNDGPKISYSSLDKLQSAGIYDGIVFHMFPIEDEDRGLGEAYGGGSPDPNLIWV